jgi:hypothetical protein
MNCYAGLLNGVGVAMHNDDDDQNSYEVGYKKPPRAGRIRKGEKRNPFGRRGKNPKPQPTASDAEILRRIDNELIAYKGENITRREAEMRVLQARSMSGDTKSTAALDRIRQAAKSVQTPVQGGGVLLLPSPVPLHEWTASAAIQQAKFRGEDPEGLAELERRPERREPTEE